jgi:hypothetical protein
MKTGKVTGTGATINISLPEFTPRKVELRNITSADQLVWVNTMPNAYGMKTVAAGTTSYITSLGVTPITQVVLGDGQSPPRGFAIGADTDINVSAEVIHWVAYE